MGFGTDGPDGGPWNMSFPMVAPFQILGPSKNPYPGTVCLPQVPLPANTTVQPGDNATIQVVELAVHGASLFSVSSSPCPASLENGEKVAMLLTRNFSVRRHHLRRARRRAPRGRQRDQLLQQQRHRLRRRLHHRHPRGQCRPGHRRPHIRRRPNRDPLLVLWPPRRQGHVRVELCRPRARRAGSGLGSVLSGLVACSYLLFSLWFGIPTAFWEWAFLGRSNG